MITLKDYFMGRDETHRDEFSEAIEHGAIDLLARVNALLDELRVTTVRVSSGWRPPTVNAKIPNAAPKSHHMTGEAIDLADPNRYLARQILRVSGILARHGLYMEDPSYAKSHVHLQTVAPASGQRIFRP